MIDPKTDTCRTIPSGASKTGWVGLATGADGKLYSAPGDGSSVLVIDPATRTCSTIPYSGKSLYGIAAAPNGKLFCAPADASDVLVIESPALMAQVSDATRPRHCHRRRIASVVAFVAASANTLAPSPVESVRLGRPRTPPGLVPALARTHEHVGTRGGHRGWPGCQPTHQTFIRVSESHIYACRATPHST